MDSGAFHKTLVTGAVAICGAAFMAAFLILNDPDDLNWKPVQIWSWVLLFPISFAACWFTGGSAKLVSCAILAGIFVGTCITLLVAYFSRANLFPIAATLWTVMAVPSVVSGGLLGWAASGLQKRRRREGA